MNTNKAFWQSACSLIIRIGAAGATLLFQIAVARLAGALALGEYLLLMNIGGIGISFGAFGLGLVATKRISRFNIDETYHARRLCLTLSSLSFIFSSLTIVAIFLIYYIFNSIVSFQTPMSSVIVLGVIIFTGSQLEILSGALRGIGSVINAQMAGVLMAPVLAIPLFLLLQLFAFPSVAMSAYAIATSMSLVTSFCLWERASPQGRHGKRYFSPGEALLEGSGFFYAGLTQMLGIWCATFIVGIYASTEEVAFFRVAERVTAIVQIASLSISYVMAPHYSRAYASRDKAALNSAVRHASLIMAIITGPMVAILLSAPQLIMSLFGSAFADKWHILVIMAIGQIPMVIFGGVTQILGMSGYATTVGNINWLSTTLGIITALLLVPKHGAIGAAIAVAISNATQVILLNCQAIKILGVDAGVYINVMRFVQNKIRSLMHTWGRE